MRALWLLVLLALALAAPAQAAPRFGHARTIVASGVDQYSRPAAAIDRRGRFVVAWVRRDGRVLARRGTRGGRLGAPHALSGPSAYEVAAALRGDGTAVVGWAREARGRQLVEVSVGSGAAQRLATVRASVIGPWLVAVGGRLVAIWRQGVPATGGHDLRYALAGARGRFGRPHTLAATGRFGPQSVAADAAGDVAVAFTTPQSPPSPYEPAAVATLPAGAAAFGAPQVFAPEGEDLAVFGGPGGFALGYGLQGTEPWRLEISGVGAAPLTAATIDASDYRTGFEGPVVALPARGGALVAWTVSHFASEEAESPNRAALYATTQQTGGGLAAPAQLAPRRALAQHLLAAATRETAILAWSEGRFGHQRLRYAVRGADGRVTRPRTLARRADGSDLSAAGDRAIATWMTGHAVRFARLDG